MTYPRPPRPPEYAEPDRKHADCWKDPNAGWLRTQRIAYIDIPTEKPPPPDKLWMGKKRGSRRQRIGLFCARCKAFWPDIYPTTIDAEAREHEDPDVIILELPEAGGR